MMINYLFRALKVWLTWLGKPCHILERETTGRWRDTKSSMPNQTNRCNSSSSLLDYNKATVLLCSSYIYTIYCIYHVMFICQYLKQ